MTVVLLVDAGLPENSLNERFRRTAITITRAIAERITLEQNSHPRRLLIHTDTATLIPVLLTAAEYFAPAGVERIGTEEAWLFVLPIIRGDSLEEGLFEPYSEEDQRYSEEDQTNMLLDLFYDMRVANDSTTEDFQNIFHLQQPRAIIALGSTGRLEHALLIAENYANENPNVRICFNSPTTNENTRDWTRWQNLELNRNNLLPTLNGEQINREAQPFLYEIAEETVEEAILALSCEQIIESIYSE